MGQRPMLVYDGDCGFCTRTARWVERLPVDVTITPWQEQDLAALGTTETRARQEVLWVSSTGRIAGGGAAVSELLRSCRAPWPILGRLLSMPLLRTIVDRCYRWVAANRYRLPGATPACQLPPEQRPGATG